MQLQCVVSGATVVHDHYLKQELYGLVQTEPSIFDFLQKGSLDGIWYWDLDAPEHEWMSPEFWLTLGYDPTEMPHLANSWQDIIHPEDRELAIANFQKHCDDPTHPYDQVVRYRHKDGSTVWVRCRGLIIRDGSGKPVRMLGAHSDLTELKKTEARLKQSNQELSQFVYAASHDLKGPLRTMQAHLDILQADYQEQLDEKGQKLIQYSLNSLIRVTGLVSDLLDFSELTHRPVSLKLTSTQQVIDGILQDLATDIDRTQATIHVLPLPDVVFEPSLLRHIFQNLIDNALKYRHPDRVPTIEIKSQTNSDGWVFSVQDNGIGIEHQYQNRIFQLFQRLHVQSEIPGSGLGLGICQKALTYVNGRMWLDSQFGQGSTFFFEIPQR